MADYLKYPDTQLKLIKEKPNYGISLTAEEEAAINSRSLTGLSAYFTNMKVNNPVKF